MGPDTSVLIPTYRRTRLLERVLADLAASELPSEITEILVIENGMRAGTEAVCERYRSRIPVRYHFIEEPGKSNALNVALHLTDADVLVLFDDDIRVESGTLHAFVRAAGEHGPGHYFGGPVAPEYESDPPPDWLGPWLTTCVVGWSLGDEERHQDEFLGANWAAFRDDLVAAGGFVKGLGPNARFRTIGQEVEMQERLMERGCRGIYVPDARVQHWVPARQCTLGWIQDRWRRQSLSQVLLAPGHPGAPRIGGVPRFLWRKYATALVKLMGARLFAPKSERRMQAERRLAVIQGRILGYRRVRKLGRLPEAAPKAGDSAPSRGSVSA